jgi:hypothetical protein
MSNFAGKVAKLGKKAGNTVAGTSMDTVGKLLPKEVDDINRQAQQDMGRIGPESDVVSQRADPQQWAKQTAPILPNTPTDVSPEVLKQLRRQKMLAAYGRSSTFLNGTAGTSGQLGAGAGNAMLGA